MSTLLCLVVGGEGEVGRSGICLHYTLLWSEEGGGDYCTLLCIGLVKERKVQDVCSTYNARVIPVLEAGGGYIHVYSSLIE